MVQQRQQLTLLPVEGLTSSSGLFSCVLQPHLSLKNAFLAFTGQGGGFCAVHSVWQCCCSRDVHIVEVRNKPRFLCQMQVNGGEYSSVVCKTLH